MALSAELKWTEKRAYKSSVREIYGDGSKAAVKVGVFGAKGAAIVEVRLRVKGKDGKIRNVRVKDKDPIRKSTEKMTVAALAMIHEYGLGVPERSFIRSYFDIAQHDLRRLILDLGGKLIVARTRAGKPITDSDRRKLLGIVGAKMVGDIQKRISSGAIVPSLNPATVKRKGSSVPLIDTGQLRSAISFLVIMGDVNDE